MRNGTSNNDLTVTLLQRFRELLADGSLTPGSRLPPERDLAKSFGVSRNSLRQALKVLGAMGVLTQRTGSGTHLCPDASSVLQQPFQFLMLLDSVSHEELFEARLIVEPELAYRAAERATLEHIGALRKAMDDMRGATERGRIVEADVAFHRAILRAAGNRVCETMFSAVYGCLQDSIKETSQLVDVEHTLDLHGDIFRAIDGRNPEAARKAMFHHISDARRVRARAALQPKPARLPGTIAVKPKGGARR